MKSSGKYTHHKRAFIIWLAIFPLITALSYLLGGVLQPLHLVLRVLIMSLIAVPLAFYIVIPFLHKVFANWINGGKQATGR